MHRFVVALSAVVSGRSAWLLLGVTGMAYTLGPSAVWAVVGFIVVELFLFLFYARRLRNFTEARNCITIPDFYAERFDDRSGLLRSLIVAIFLVFMIGFVSAQFVAGGKAFASGFGLEMNTGILLTAVIVVVYTILGGFLAVSLTDTIQGIFMILALVVLAWMWHSTGLYSSNLFAGVTVLNAVLTAWVVFAVTIPGPAATVLAPELRLARQQHQRSPAAPAPPRPRPASADTPARCAPDGRAPPRAGCPPPGPDAAPGTSGAPGTAPPRARPTAGASTAGRCSSPRPRAPAAP
jgi:Na+(H+)/acetate symporter ActP